MNWLEKRKYIGPKNKGLCLGKYRLTLQNSFKNLFLEAPTGGGKSLRYVIPNILKCSGSIVVTDPSSEIYKKTHKSMIRKGYNVLTLNPLDINNSQRFNPLTKPKNSQEIKQLATTIGVQNTSPNTDPFWTVGATKWIKIISTALINQGIDSQINLGTVLDKLNTVGVNGEGIRDFLAKHLDDKTFNEFKALISEDSKTMNLKLSSARTSLDLWDNEYIDELTKSNTIDIEALGRDKTIIYLMIPEHQVSYYSALINLFYTTCFDYCLGDQTRKDQIARYELLKKQKKQIRPEDVPIPIFFFLDEFGNLGRIPNFATTATTLRKRHCSLSMIVQERSQLDAIYGHHEAKAIFSGGCANKLFFSGLDLETCTYLEKVLGMRTAQDVVDDVGSRERAITTGRPLMSLDQIRMMGPEEAIYVGGSMLPAKLKMKFS